MRSRPLALVGVVLALALVVGSGGFSAATTERTVAVDTVGDDHAYMALQYSDRPVAAGTAVGDGVDVALVTVTNQFTQPVDVTIDAEVRGAGGVSVAVTPERARLGVGDAVDASLAVTCERGGTRRFTVAFGVSATGEGVAAETTAPRTVAYEVDCTAATTETPTP